MKYTKEHFIYLSRKIHGEKYDYSKVVYNGSRVKVEIICPTHGSFWQEPADHIRGRGCNLCNKHHKMNNIEFIEKASKKHNNFYDYSLSNYIDAFTKVKIICPLHGVFEQSPSTHIYGQGCPKCKAEKISKNLKKTREVFIHEMNSIYGDSYDFSISNYSGTHNEVDVICKKHGVFRRTPHELLDGKGCKVCCKNMKLDTDSFILKAKEIYGDLYCYDNVNYIDTNTKVLIICPVHGEFAQRPHDHIIRGCPKCGHENGGKKLSEQKTFTQSQFLERCKETHGDTYDYSKAIYKGYNDKVIIICKKHGDFSQIAGEHMNGAGCPHCKKSMGEKRVYDFLSKNNIQCKREYEIKNTYALCTNNIIRVDFYLPDYNAFIEYNGGQHYRPVKWFGGIEKFNEQQARDLALRLYCEQNKIKLIEIPYWDFDKIEEVLKRELKIKTK